MKILYVITRAERGGAQVHLVDLLTSLPSGYTAVLATGEQGYLTEEAAKLDIPVRYVPDLVQPISPIKDLRASLTLTKLISSESPDLVHAHTSKAGLLGRVAAFLTGTPSVFTAHTWSFTDGVSWKQRALAVPLERLAAIASRKIVNVSQANLDLALRKSIAGPKKLVCIRNGIPDVTLRSKPSDDGLVTLTMVARFAEQKDHLLLIEALSGISGNWRLLLVGDGPTRSQVEQAVDTHELRERVFFLGERKDIADLLSSSNVFVLASKWEGLPLSILEGMRAGLPVIATNVGGVAEAVRHGVTGYLTPLHDAVTLRNCIQELLSSSRLRKEMGEAGRLLYEQEFRLETMVQKTLGIYHEVLAEKRAPLADGTVNTYKALK